MGAKENRRTFRFHVEYFKPSGKFYTEAEFEAEVGDCGPEGHPSAYMSDVCDMLRNWGASEKGGLPGLCGETWDGPVYVTCEEGFPCLLLPKT